jgi:hypothetical protein
MNEVATPRIVHGVKIGSALPIYSQKLMTGVFMKKSSLFLWVVLAAGGNTGITD